MDEGEQVRRRVGLRRLEPVDGAAVAVPAARVVRSARRRSPGGGHVPATGCVLLTGSHVHRTADVSRRATDRRTG